MATYDLKIAGGEIIDGSGRPRFRGDVGVKGGRIVDIGACDGAADEVIDAQGAIVTPGFVDIHTHFDGQASWDEELAPSCLHGVTTAVMGNCGVGFAPVRSADQERLIELMEGVEDIPGSALSEGLTWRWETLGDYMQEIDRRPHTIDLGVQVPHDALRVYVMGERGIAGEDADDEDVEAMRALTLDALQEGAVGLSTGRTDNHRTARGRATPASEATVRELRGLAQAFAEARRGVLQAVSDFDYALGDDRFEAEFDVLEQMAVAAGRPLSISLLQRDQCADQWRAIVARAEQAQARGTTIRLQVAPRPIGVLLGLEATFHPFVGFPSYKTIRHLPVGEQARQMAQPEFKARLLGEKSERLAGDGSPIPPLADQLLAQLEVLTKRIFRLGESPQYEPDPRTCLFAEAAASGRTALETVYEALLEHDGRALLYFPIYNFTENSLDNVRTMLDHPLSLPGLSDAGAHVGTICDGSFPTYLLAHWGRDRPEGRFPLERLVQMQTHDTASYVGFHDRGTLEPGKRADLNLIEIDNLRLSPPRIQVDLPAGGRRLMQRAHGYRATIVAGQTIVADGTVTENRPGRLARPQNSSSA